MKHLTIATLALLFTATAFGALCRKGVAATWKPAGTCVAGTFGNMTCQDTQLDVNGACNDPKTESHSCSCDQHTQIKQIYTPTHSGACSAGNPCKADHQESPGIDYQDCSNPSDKPCTTG